ncbi:MAG TPA: DinB family protein [Thermoanaerobaculia bacterium]|nr:DinB family protein [Thermoanaerobaculia bacterium]
MSTTPATPLRPEQDAALRYAREKGTEASVDSIRQRLSGTFAKLEGLLASLPERVVRIRPAPDRWSIHEIVDHLVESHRPAVDSLRELVRGHWPEGGPIPASLLSADPLGRPWPSLVRELSGVHRQLLAILDGASDETPLTARAPVVMVVKIRAEDGSLTPVEWVDDFDWKAFAIILRAHTLEHVAQIERTLAAVGAADPRTS